MAARENAQLTLKDELEAVSRIEDGALLWCVAEDWNVVGFSSWTSLVQELFEKGVSSNFWRQIR